MSTENTTGTGGGLDIMSAESDPTTAYPVNDTPETDPEAAEEARIRAAERAARERALGRVTPVDDEVRIAEEPVSENDRFRNSFAIFLLRLVAGLLVGARGALIILNIDDATAQLAGLAVPYAEPLAWVLGLVLVVAALLLVLGLGTRTGAVLTAGYAIAVLTFLRWGAFSPFSGGIDGIYGDVELLLAGIAIAVLLFGSGGWGIDHALRTAKAKRRLYQ